MFTYRDFVDGGHEMPRVRVERLEQVLENEIVRAYRAGGCRSTAAGCQ